MADQAHNAALRQTLDCIVCGTQFEAERKGKGRHPGFCSAACRRQRVRQRHAQNYIPKIHKHQCPGCGASFESSRPEAKWCSIKCARAGQPVLPKNRPVEDRACRGCGATFTVRKDNDRKFCTNACREEHRPPPRVVPKWEPHETRCTECNAEFIPASPTQRLCSEGCKKARASRRSKEQAQRAYTSRPCTCKECQAIFTPTYGNKSRAYCSAACARKASRKMRPAGNDRKRARAHGVEYQYVNPIKVLARDNWTCQLCGKPTPRKLRGTFEPRAPEVDHIQPISKGGAHTYANLQCACRACNMAKGNTPMGQLKLFAA